MMGHLQIKQVSPERLQEIILRYAPCGRFLARDGRKWVAVDNSTGDAWAEKFRWKRQAIRWLLGEFERGE